jgi:hypothetical protein
MHSGEKIPGYTGFVPFRFENIGVTVGQANRVAEQAYRSNFFKATGKEISYSTVDPNSRTGNVNMDIRPIQKKMMVDNHSRHAKSWMCGPQHEIRNQSVPGYTGFIPAVQAENVFAISYGKATGKSYANKVVKGADHPANKRYASLYKSKYSDKQFRRVLEKPEDMSN